MPAVLDWQNIQISQDAGRTQLRKAIDRQDGNMLASNARLHAAREILSSENVVQIDRDGRSREGVIDAGNREMQVAQERVKREAGIVRDVSESVRVEKRAEHILEGLDLGAEVLQCCLGGPSGGVLPAFVKPAFDPLFGCQRGQVGQGEKILGLE